MPLYPTSVLSSPRSKAPRPPIMRFAQLLGTLATVDGIYSDGMTYTVTVRHFVYNLLRGIEALLCSNSKNVDFCLCIR